MKRLSHLMTVAVLLGVVGLAACQFLQAGCAQAPSSTANLAAQDDLAKAVQPRLEQLALTHPDHAATVRALVDGWSTRTDRDNFEAAAPLLDLWAADHPNDEGLRLLRRNWQRRLTKFEAPPPILPPA